MSIHRGARGRPPIKVARRSRTSTRVFCRRPGLVRWSEPVNETGQGPSMLDSALMKQGSCNTFLQTAIYLTGEIPSPWVGPSALRALSASRLRTPRWSLVPANQAPAEISSEAISIVTHWPRPAIPNSAIRDEPSGTHCRDVADRNPQSNRTTAACSKTGSPPASGRPRL